MKTLSAMDLRKHLGAVIDDVRLRSETFILERAGKAVAVIAPVGFADNNADDKGMRDNRLKVLNDLDGFYADHARSDDVQTWIRKERDSWERDL